MEINVIEVDVKSKDIAFNIFNENQISDDMGNYIFNNSKKSGINSKLIINIDNKVEFNKEEQERIVDAIREYFGLLIREKMHFTRFNNMKKLILIFIGVLLMLLYDSTRNSLGFLIPEVMSVAGCVAIWEVVHIILFEDTKNRFEIKKLRQLTNCEINFINYK
jgi:hypothetical protein